MVTQIDNLKLPPNGNGHAELFHRDSSRRTVSGRLITKLSPTEKWRLTIAYDETALALPFQQAFYDKCREMRVASRPVTFLSPYDGQEYTIMARCMSRATPSVFSFYKRRPEYYLKAGAVFEEV